MALQRDCIANYWQFCVAMALSVPSQQHFASPCAYPQKSARLEQEQFLTRNCDSELTLSLSNICYNQFGYFLTILVAG